MKLRRSVGLSIRALLAHRLRTALAAGSVGTGVAAVLITGALGAGAEEVVRSRIQGLGANLLVVRPAQVKRLVARKDVRGVVTTLRVEDAVALETLALVAQTAPDVEAPVRVKGDGAAMKTKVVGTTPAFRTVRSFRMRSGRFLDDGDDRAASRVAVLGARVADSLYPGDDPVGQEIRIRGVPFDVIGILEAKGMQADGDEDNQVVVPIRTALRRVFNTTSLSAIFVSVTDDRAMSAAEAEVGAVLREGHRRGRDDRPDDFEVQNAARMFALQKRTADSLRLLTAGLAVLTLSVGGVGILALMFMSVKERTREIGLRIAVGGTPRNILVQFLLEAAMLALGGWTAGLAAGAAGAAVVGAATAWKIGVPAAAVAASLAMALTIGLGFGALPARKASRVPPIQALVAE